MMLKTDVRGLAMHTEPFVVGDLDPDREFVHVFDDTTLDIIMSTLDTTEDFLRYLRKKEELCRSRTVYVAGEENLLAYFVTHIDEQGEHAFDFDPDLDLVMLDETWWADFASSRERRAQVEQDEISYVWDRLIERFGRHALGGTQYFVTEPSFVSSETVLRFMAAEPRFRRRALSEALVEAIETTEPSERRLRVIPSQHQEQPTYVFLLFPWREDRSEEQNRRARRNYLEASLLVTKVKYPDALDVVGIATESGAAHAQHSEDAMYLDARVWSAEDKERALRYQRDLGILVAGRPLAKHFEEYPRKPAKGRSALPKNPRNKPCPCGSQRKYKFCHGR
jgi:GNAT superfamily N-acetyltransferase